MALPHEAVRNALATHLATYLAGNWPTVQVLESMPLAQKLLSDPSIAISISSVETEDHEPMPWTVTATTGVNGSVVYSYGRATIGLQLDVWTTYPARRDAICGDIHGALNLSPQETLGLSGAPTLRRHPGLVLLVPEMFNVTAAYEFKGDTSLTETSQGASTDEWRASFDGEATIYLMDSDSVALMKQIEVSFNGIGLPF